MNHIPLELLPPVAGDELFSDTYKIVLKDECLYEVWGKVSTYLNEPNPSL